MNVLQITKTTIYPPTKGGEHRSHGLLVSFPDEGDTVIRYCQGGLLTNHKLFDIKQQVEIANGYVEYRPLNPFHDIPSLIQLILDIPGYSNEKFLEISFPNKLLKYLQWSDIVLVEGPFQLSPVASKVDDTPIIYSSHNVESERIETGNRYLKNWYDTYVNSVEMNAIKSADGIIYTSERDKQIFEQEYSPDIPMFYAPNGTYQESLRGRSADNNAEYRDKLGISDKSLVGLFVGSKYGPNIAAAAALPQIVTEVNKSREFDVLVAGTVSKNNPDLESAKHLHPLGFVDDLETVYNLSDIGLNPITSGGGTNIKMIEYMAKGLAVVTTPFGARGFDITGGKNAIVAEIDEFASVLASMSEKTIEDIGGNALDFVRDNHIWEEISIQLNQDLHDEYGLNM
jgi:glycosyltransferase involved in cell wall biosynthesis